MEGRFLTEERIIQFRQHLISEEKSANTVDKYMRDVRVFSGFLAGREIAKEIAVAYKQKLVNDAFHHRLILRRSNAARQDRDAIVLRHFIVRLVQHNFGLPVGKHTCFQVITLQNPCDAAEIPERVNVRCDPTFLIHGEKGFHIGVSAAGQYGNKDVCRNRFSCIRVDDGGGIPGPVHLHDISGLVLQMHSGVCLYDVIVVVFVELCGLVRQFSGKPALLTVFQLKQFQRNAAAL